MISVIPNSPGFRANLERVIADLYLKMMEEEIRKQTEPPKPPVEMIPLENLLRPIAQEIATNSKAETNLQTIVDSLKNNYHVRKNTAIFHVWQEGSSSFC